MSMQIKSSESKTMQVISSGCNWMQVNASEFKGKHVYVCVYKGIWLNASERGIAELVVLQFG